MNIYFSGVGGVGIGPLVHIALDAGYTVQGSDAIDSPLTRELQSRGVSLSIGQDGAFLKACHEAQPIDWFIYTSALPENHPELVLARQLGIKTAKRDELLARIIKEKNLKLIAVAGTHGKTTTTGMIIWAFKQLGIPISYSIGTTISFGPSGKFDPTSEYFVYECDEFDRNFLHFQPSLSVITTIDYDHSDTYPTVSDYMKAFTQFITQSDMAIIWKVDSASIDLTQTANWTLNQDEVLPLHLPGEHYRRNGTLAIKTMEYLKIGTPDGMVSIINTFPGTDRRFERLADNLYTDYGHHPTEIMAMLQLARELNDHVILVYQPHQNIRQHEVSSQYANTFVLAERVYWLPTYLSREDPNLPILSPEQLTQTVTNRDAVYIADLNDELWNNIQQARKDGKLILCMGAGTIDGWIRNQLTA